MKEIIQVINKEFGENRTVGAVFFHQDPVTGAKTASPLFMMDQIQGENIQSMIARLNEWSHALKYMADDMVKRTLNKN